MTEEVRQLEDNFTSEGMTRYVLWSGDHSILVAVTDKDDNVIVNYEVWRKKILPQSTAPNGKLIPSRVKKMKSSDFGKHAWSLSVSNKKHIMAMIENLENELNPYGYAWDDNVSMQMKIDKLNGTEVEHLTKLEDWLFDLINSRDLEEVEYNIVVDYVPSEMAEEEPEPEYEPPLELEKSAAELQVEEYLKNPPFDFTINRRKNDFHDVFYGDGETTDGEPDIE
jgi:hypothetical protein